MSKKLTLAGGVNCCLCLLQRQYINFPSFNSWCCSACELATRAIQQKTMNLATNSIQRTAGAKAASHDRQIVFLPLETMPQNQHGLAVVGAAPLKPFNMLAHMPCVISIRCAPTSAPQLLRRLILC